ncbi:hypothetical protein HPB51_028329 [Rhipicephalus microplus]|uniref:Uncharacterized protein n=1 Tax=Rhipicephalus microplus TaxID=6941 RepID=A0A9J6CXK8_RHIMP|nr:hypothetical protein HPB51_028329 [Rhipicephalus microplus]
MECRASRRNVEDANQGDIFQEVRLDDNGNMEEAPITGSVDVVYAPFWRQVSGRGAAHPDGGDVLVRRRHAAVVVRHPGVALLHHVGGRPFSPRDKPLPKPEPTMTIKLRVADLPESLLGALRQRGAAGSGLGNGSAASAAAASDPSRGRGDGRRHSPAAPPLLAGSDHRAAVQRPGEPMMSAQMYGDSALAEEGYSNIGRVGPGSSRGDVKEIVVIQSPICGQVWESQRIDCHPEAAPSLESCRFHTNLSTLVFADQFLQMSTYIPSRYVYGVGDVKSPLLRSTDWQKITLFNAGRSPMEGKNLYSSHPFMLVHEETGESCGIFLLNSNAMDILLKPSPSVTFRTTGGILDVFVFLGPTPSEVVQQYTALVGRPAMPPYWALGFHLSRWGYANIDEVKETRRRNLRVGIPVEAVWLDAEYMEGLRPFTYDKVRFAGLPEFAQDLHKRDMKFVLTLVSISIHVSVGLDANMESGSYLPFDEGHKAAVFVRSEAGDYNYGMVGNRSRLVYPDFTHPASGEYWTKMLSYFHDVVPFDGLWLDLNEPSSLYNGSERGCPASTLEEPPYLPGEGHEALRTKTLCMTGRHYLSRHYNLHNLYGLMEALRTYDSLRQILLRRPFIISRSTFSGQGRYSGHWSGDIESDWDAMRSSLASMLTFNILGVPLTGSDICGFWDNTTSELCNRWHALGAFYPFARNHNAKGNLDQDPAAMGGAVAATAKKTLKIRYCFLPYLYTLFYRSHVFGETVARPLFFEFPKDVNTYAVDTQFLWGSALLVLPILEPNSTSVKPYLPRGIWYDVMLGLPYHSAGEDFQMSPLNDSICLLIRGGHVVPSQEPAQTTAARRIFSRLKPFNLLVAQDQDSLATGELYWDDGEYVGSYEKGEYSLIKFVAVKNTVVSMCVHCGYDSIMLLNAVTVYGVTEKPREVHFNRLPTNFTYNPAGQVGEHCVWRQVPTAGTG